MHPPFIGSEQKLLVIADHRPVGFLPGGHEVFKIEKIACINLSVDSEQEMELKVSYTLKSRSTVCHLHQNDGEMKMLEMFLEPIEHSF